jgi:hypothetical protein
MKSVSVCREGCIKDQETPGVFTKRRTLNIEQAFVMRATFSTAKVRWLVDAASDIHHQTQSSLKILLNDEWSRIMWPTPYNT